MKTEIIYPYVKTKKKNTKRITLKVDFYHDIRTSENIIFKTKTYQIRYNEFGYFELVINNQLISTSPYVKNFNLDNVKYAILTLLKITQETIENSINIAILRYYKKIKEITH